MDTLNSVEINKIKVTPLSEWNYLLTQTPPMSCAWPQSSALLCWWCCHSFSNVPAYLPVKVDLKREKGTFVFTGNFCSWNCVKGYALRLEKNHKTPSGCYYIGLLAFLTASSPIVCQDDVNHDLGLCDCLQTYKGVHLPLGKEVLQSFGGTIGIQEYRHGFHIIGDYNVIRRTFSTVQDVTRVAQAAQKTKNAKFWGFQYLHYAGPDASYTTFVNVLPLTNRTFDKRMLVTTGNETTGANTNQMTETESAPKTGTQKNKQTAPRAQKIDRRSNKQSRRPTRISSSSSSSSSSCAVNAVAIAGTDDARPTMTPSVPGGTQHHNPLHQPFRSSSGPIMTNEQVLACNDEQQFYTNSLRGYGNILTSMGIEVSRPPK